MLLPTSQNKLKRKDASSENRLSLGTLTNVELKRLVIMSCALCSLYFRFVYFSAYQLFAELKISNVAGAERILHTSTIKWPAGEILRGKKQANKIIQTKPSGLPVFYVST